MECHTIWGLMQRDLGKVTKVIRFVDEVVDKVRWKKKKYLILKFVLRCLMTQSVGISFFSRTGKTNWRVYITKGMPSAFRFQKHSLCGLGDRCTCFH